MREMALAELERLGAELDIYTGSSLAEEEVFRFRLFPPLPVSRQTLVWGFHLLRQAREKGQKSLPCTVLPPLPPLQLLKASLLLENRPGRYTWGEKEGMLGFACRAGFPAGCGELSPWIEGRRVPGLGEQIRGFSALPEPLKGLVGRGFLDLKTALKVHSLPETVFRRLEAEEGRLTFSQRRILLVQLLELSARKALPAEEVLTLWEDALGSGDPLEKLGRLRYPRLTALEDRFRQIEAGSVKGSGITLSPPSFFEGDSYQVSFRFTSPQALSRKLQALQRLRSQSDELFSLLH